LYFETEIFSAEISKEHLIFHSKHIEKDRPAEDWQVIWFNMNT